MFILNFRCTFENLSFWIFLFHFKRDWSKWDTFKFVLHHLFKDLFLFYISAVLKIIYLAHVFILNRVDLCMVKAHVINHVLNNWKDVLVHGRKADHCVRIDISINMHFILALWNCAHFKGWLFIFLLSWLDLQGFIWVFLTYGLISYTASYFRDWLALLELL